MHVGIAGEVRCVVTKADGTVKEDTGFQKNVILNQGLEFFGKFLNNSPVLYGKCVIGSGNSKPVITQNALDSPIAGTDLKSSSYTNDYDKSRDGNLYKTSKTCVYRFSNLNNVNISEIGLSYASYTDTYNMCTRALLKDNAGNPTTITILVGETLDVYYKIWQIFDLVDKKGIINLLNNSGESVAYNYTCRMAGVGGTNLGGSAAYGSIIGSAMCSGVGNNGHYLYSGELGSITGEPQTWLSYFEGGLPTSTYVTNSNKIIVYFNCDLSKANGNVRSLKLITTMGFYQVRYGSVANDSPIVKSNKDTLSIPIEVSWGRYEGSL